MAKQGIQVGSQVEFIGFSDEGPPDNGELLVVGEVYTVTQVIDEHEKPGMMDSYNVGPFETPNPNYNPDKRKSKNNRPTEQISVDLFPDECKLVEAKTTRTKAKAKPAVEQEEPEEEEQSDSAEIPFAEVVKGQIVSVVDTDGEVCEGEVIKKTKAVLGILMGDEEITYKKAEIVEIMLAGVDEQTGPEEEEPEEQEEAPAKATVKKKKTAAKKKTVTKKKTAAKKKTSARVAKTATKSEEAEVDSDLKKIIVLTDEEDDEDIVALIAESDDICGLAIDLAEDAATVDYRLAGVLYHVYVDKAYKELDGGAYAGNKGFELYADKELGVGYRKAMYLIKGYGSWNKLGLSSEDFTSLGWTKAVAVADVGTEDNIDDLMELASESSLTELRETIKESYSKEGKDTRDVIKKITFKFRLVEDAAAAVVEYLEMAGKQLQEKDDSKIFEQIVSEWAAEHLDVSKVSRTQKKTKAAATTSSRKKTKATAKAA